MYVFASVTKPGGAKIRAESEDRLRAELHLRHLPEFPPLFSHGTPGLFHLLDRRLGLSGPVHGLPHLPPRPLHPDGVDCFSAAKNFLLQSDRRLAAILPSYHLSCSRPPHHY